MAVSHWIKAVAVTSIIFGLLALTVSCWTFGSIIVYHSHFEMQQDDKTKTTVSSKDELSAILPERTPYVYPYSKQHNSTTISKLWARLDDMTEYFKTLMIVCTWVVNVAVLVQIIVAFTVLFRVKERISTAAKYFVGSHFVVFIVLLICFFIPLSEDRQNNTHHTVTGFNDVVMAEFESLNDIGIKYVWQDVHAYYFAVAFNFGAIFIVMITACCLLRCDTQSYDSV